MNGVVVFIFPSLFPVFVFHIFPLLADGIKLRASKSEGNGTARPPESTPVSNTATPFLGIVVWSLNHYSAAVGPVLPVPHISADGSTDLFFFLQEDDLKWVEDNIPSSLTDV